MVLREYFASLMTWIRTQICIYIAALRFYLCLKELIFFLLKAYWHILYITAHSHELGSREAPYLWWLAHPQSRKPKCLRSGRSSCSEKDWETQPAECHFIFTLSTVTLSQMGWVPGDAPSLLKIPSCQYFHCTHFLLNGFQRLRRNNDTLSMQTALLEQRSHLLLGWKSFKRNDTALSWEH